MPTALANGGGDSRSIPGASPTLSIVLPARDEAAGIQTAVLAVSEFLNELGLASQHKTRASALQLVR